MSERPVYIILLGPPGSGKGTQADILQERIGLPHVASGDLFRYNLKNKTPLGLKAKAYMDRGDLVPDDITIAMVLDRLAREDCAKGAILDGFPRTIAQAEALDAALAEKGLGIDKALNIIVPDEVIIERITGRRICPVCGATYHVKFNPPKEDNRCDNDGAELYQRDDDKPETVRNRLKVYRELTSPLVDYYRAQGLLVAIDGNRPIAEVTEAILQALEGLV